MYNKLIRIVSVCVCVLVCLLVYVLARLIMSDKEFEQHKEQQAIQYQCGAE